MSWGGKVLGLPDLLDSVVDSRPRPQIPTRAVVRAIWALFVLRLGSLNALEQTKLSRFWRGWLGRDLPSADSLGRVCEGMDLDSLRDALRGLYERLRRSKALAPTSHGLTALVLDGHEPCSSYRRCCSGCLERRIKTRNGYRTQYYHRIVVAMLLTRPRPLLLDVEALGPADTEITAARRLLARLLVAYPRAFDVVLGDALYTDTSVYRLLQAHHKDVLTVLKRNAPDLLSEAVTLLDGSPHIVLPKQGGDRLVWDLEGFNTWPVEPVRILRSNECAHIRRQLDGESESQLSEWFWVTTLSRHRAPTAAVVELAHARWDIENHGFLEMGCRWHADHVYRHHPVAMLSFLLIAMLAHNSFYYFYFRNLHPKRRRQSSPLHLSHCLRIDLLEGLPSPRPRGP